ncbi:MAG: ChbG/HpnK family deacetylase [Planctomycetes bacterium]|nr:ChbG/HpnK family deacetylase [Planctomycetota bacterium]
MPAVRSLIVTADDFGLAPGVDEAICRLAAAGAVTSVSVLALRATPEALAALRAAAPDVGLGLHVDLTADLQHYQPGDVEARVAAQWERFVRLTGRAPEHLDTHKQVHAGFPEAFAALCARGVPVRATSGRLRRALRRRGIACPDAFAGFVTSRPAWTRARILAAVRNLTPGVTEWMCHPALHGPWPAGLRYTGQRCAEYRAFAALDFPALCRAHGVATIRPRDLPACAS